MKINNTESQLIAMFGKAALTELQAISGTTDLDAMTKYFSKCKDTIVVLPVEIDKMSLSNGEKQIFIMALYHSLVQLCNQSGHRSFTGAGIS